MSIKALKVLSYYNTFTVIKAAWPLVAYFPRQFKLCLLNIPNQIYPDHSSHLVSF